MPPPPTQMCTRYLPVKFNADPPLSPVVLLWYVIESAVSGQLDSSACYGSSASPSLWETVASWELCTLEDLSQD